MGTSKGKVSVTRKAARKILPKPLRRELRDLHRSHKAATRRAKEPQANTYQGKNTFTIISAAYNVERYLDAFFISLFNQTINKECLRIIVVDDGSTDGTAEKVLKWQEKWPGAITYLYKENGGQASARNLGLDQKTSEWVTFIDPDDFVSKRYFENVDCAICSHPSLVLASCNLYFYHERKKGKKYKNNHPLSWRFKNGDTYFAAGDENMFPQLSASSAFLRKSIIEQYNLRFDEDIKPTFEDAHFVNRYLVRINSGQVGFLASPRYYYRKRSDSSSTLDQSWDNPSIMVARTRAGYHDLLRDAYQVMAEKYVPQNIQRTILYDWKWFLRYMLDHPDHYEWREKETPGILVESLSAWRDCMAYIDFDVLMDAPGQIMNYEQKFFTADLFFSDQTAGYRIAYLRNIDLNKQELLVEVFGQGTEFYLDGRLVTALQKKRVSHVFLGTDVADTYMIWVPYEASWQVLSFRSKGREKMMLSVRGKKYKSSATIDELLLEFTKKWDDYKQLGDTWLIMDRDTQADDNGEHFCRYMLANHPEQRVVFALRKDAPQWESLKSEGFPLVEFGTTEFEREAKACSKIISAHADAYIHSYFGDNYHQSKDFIFLQHGVTKDNVSSWLNPKPISLLVTSTQAEHDSIAQDGSRYRITAKQVQLLGFPRHDMLLEKQKLSKEAAPCILIMPTWRNDLSGERIDKGNRRRLSPLFKDSQYRFAWEGFLKSEPLKKYAQDGVRIVFFPHANMLAYVRAHQLEMPEYIELGSCDGASIQDYFVRASVLITDYSSVAFEVAYLEKPIVYYQFDEEEFFGGAHIFSKGYFDYRQDGFGPVTNTQEEALDELDKIIKRGFVPDNEYAIRMKETFPFRDGKCCERVYNAIKALDAPR